MAASPKPPLHGTRIVITRPVGAGGALARRVRVLGGTPILVPGASLRAAADVAAARRELRDALACGRVIFTSPAAVRFASALQPMRTRAVVIAPGAGTRRALRRAGLADACVPTREDSEGMLALAQLANVRGRRIGIIGAAGGRGLLARELAARGATLVHAHVYQRLPARLDGRHAQALLRAPREPLFVLLSSSEALANILGTLPADARIALLAATAIASSARLADAARRAGFARIARADAAQPSAMLEAVLRARRAASPC